MKFESCSCGRFGCVICVMERIKKEGDWKMKKKVLIYIFIMMLVTILAGCTDVYQKTIETISGRLDHTNYDGWLAEITVFFQDENSSAKIVFVESGKYWHSELQRYKGEYIKITYEVGRYSNKILSIEKEGD